MRWVTEERGKEGKWYVRSCGDGVSSKNSSNSDGVGGDNQWVDECIALLHKDGVSGKWYSDGDD